MLTWFKAWRERFRRMRWFLDEFLPEVEAAAKRDGTATVAAQIIETHSMPAHAEAATAAAGPRPDAQGLQKLDEMLRRLPDSERERLKAFVKSPGGF